MKPLHVLVVDDSAVVRQAMTALLEDEMRVSTAADPFIAMKKMEAARPDVIVLDLEMPRMDGLTFLRKLMDESPIPVVVCSSLTASSSELTMRALQLGAVDVVEKPKVRAGESPSDSAIALIETIRGAALARVRRVGRAPAARPLTPAAPIANRLPNCHVIVIGASTGGTEVLRQFLDAMPADAPPIVIVQHMPERFTSAFARRLNESSAMDVREAAPGDLLRPGLALIAPGDRHITLLRQGAGTLAVALQNTALVNRHRPSVDVLFSSAARMLGNCAIGVLMTGMGRDGAKGLREMRTAGAHTMVQDEATSVVFGMPKAAIELDAAMYVLPGHALAPSVLEACTGR
ncbi:MAG: two-component system, chemotaxis family, protein-glutamate methylesterase/glutaminase [Acidobacteriota bacterium]|nr:two-component system, chemotaxis family, protein-glutamate methylesterase/glutaminase [Acidobacteriota bacterium]